MTSNRQQNPSPATAALGSALGYRVFYLLIQWGGRRAAYWLLYPVCAFYLLFRAQVRRGCAPYVRRRFAASTSVGGLWHSYRMVLAFAKVLVDRAVVGMLGSQALGVTLHGRQALLDVHNQRRGMILMMSHVGCWQVAMSALDFLQEPVHMSMQHDPGSLERHYYEYNAQPCPYHTIDPRGYLGGALEMLAVLKQGQVLAVMGDRLPEQERNSVEVTFLGQSLHLPFSAFQLASATAAPVLVMFTRKDTADSYALTVADIIHVPAGLGRKAQAFQPYVQRYVRALEKYCDENPYQFFNFFNMWK